MRASRGPILFVIIMILCAGAAHVVLDGAMVRVSSANQVHMMFGVDKAAFSAPLPYPDEKYRQSARPGPSGSAGIMLAAGGIVLYESGRVVLYRLGKEPEEMPDLKPPVPVAAITTWYPSFLTTEAGDAWVHREGKSGSEWVKVSR